MANIYDAPGATPVDLFLANQTAAYIAAHLRPCKVYIETDTDLVTYTNEIGGQFHLQNRESIILEEQAAAPSNEAGKLKIYYLSSNPEQLFAILPDGSTREITLGYTS